MVGRSSNQIWNGSVKSKTQPKEEPNKLQESRKKAKEENNTKWGNNTISLTSFLIIFTFGCIRRYYWKPGTTVFSFPFFNLLGLPFVKNVVLFQISTMNNLMPTAQNQEMIKLALSQTFSYRRNWIIAIQPSTTEILQRFKHLKSFEGNMACFKITSSCPFFFFFFPISILFTYTWIFQISEEFRLMEPLHDDLITKFKRATPMILAYAKAMKPKLVEEVSSKFLNGLLPISYCFPNICYLCNIWLYFLSFFFRWYKSIIFNYETAYSNPE